MEEIQFKTWAIRLSPDSPKKEDTALMIPLCSIISQHDERGKSEQSSCCDPLRSFGGAL